jgi:hypothetical protein
MTRMIAYMSRLRVEEYVRSTAVCQVLVRCAAHISIQVSGRTWLWEKGLLHLAMATARLTVKMEREGKDCL